MDDPDKQPFLSHLEELRKRLIACFVAIGVGFVIAYSFKDWLLNILLAPIRPAISADAHLIFTAPTEMFMTTLKVAFIGGILLVIPFIAYQLWMFVAPGLYKNEKKAVTPLVFFSSILFALGAVFAYFVVLPIAFQFLLGFQTEGSETVTAVKAMISVKEGFGFSIKMLFAFGAAYQLPIIMYFLTRMGAVTPVFLRKKWSYACLFCFVIGAILTPPDILSQFLLAIPLMALYEVGILVSKIAVRSKKNDKGEVEVEGE